MIDLINHSAPTNLNHDLNLRPFSGVRIVIAHTRVGIYVIPPPKCRSTHYGECPAPAAETWAERRHGQGETIFHNIAMSHPSHGLTLSPPECKQTRTWDELNGGHDACQEAKDQHHPNASQTGRHDILRSMRVVWGLLSRGPAVQAWRRWKWRGLFPIAFSSVQTVSRCFNVFHGVFPTTQNY